MKLTWVSECSRCETETGEADRTREDDTEARRLQARPEGLRGTDTPGLRSGVPRPRGQRPGTGSRGRSGPAKQRGCRHEGACAGPGPGAAPPECTGLGRAGPGRGKLPHGSAPARGWRSGRAAPAAAASSFPGLARKGPQLEGAAPDRVCPCAPVLSQAPPPLPSLLPP